MPALILSLAAALLLLGWRHLALRAAHRRAQAEAWRLRQLADHGGELGWVIDCATRRLAYLSPGAGARFGEAGAQALAAQLLAELPARLHQFAANPAARRLTYALAPFDAGRSGSDADTQREADSAAEMDPGMGADAARAPLALEVVSTVVTDAAGRPQALVGVLRDIGARQAQEAEQKRLVSMLSHEFRTPLATLDGVIQRLDLSPGAADEATRKRYRKMRVAVERLLELLEAYLSPERLARAGRPPLPKQLALPALLAQMTAAAAAGGRQVRLREAGLPDSVRADPDGIRLCLQVLLDNAVKYTPDDCVIDIAAGPAPEGGIAIAVSDDGPGIVEEDLPHLFDKGYRGGNVDGVAGSGLGLYLARAVVDAHGGTLSALPRPEGGAQFRIWLPIGAAPGKNLASGDCNRDNFPRQADPAADPQHGAQHARPNRNEWQQ